MSSVTYWIILKTLTWKFMKEWPGIQILQFHPKNKDFCITMENQNVFWRNTNSIRYIIYFMEARSDGDIVYEELVSIVCSSLWERQSLSYSAGKGLLNLKYLYTFQRDKRKNLQWQVSKVNAFRKERESLFLHFFNREN